MKKPQKIILIASAALIVALGAILFIQRRRIAKATYLDSPINSVSGSGTKVKALFPLQFGSRGDEVKQLQTWLNANKPPFFNRLVIDGIWGTNTDNLVKYVLGTKTIDKTMFNEKIA